MSAIKELFSSKTNGLNVKLFEYNIEDEESFKEIKEYLIDRVRKSKVHNVLEYDLTYYGSANLNPEFIKKFNEKVAEINIPQKARKIPHFDVRRERVTEWMAQYLLENQYGCRFYEEADKRMNLETVDIDKHTSGIDVPGIMFEDNSVKFVVCEVKASEEVKIPCGSSESLMEDIQKSINNYDNRVSREILQYMHGIRNVKMADEEITKILEFLAKLVVNGQKNSSENLATNIMFFPVLIRKNDEIIKNKNINDYRDFTVEGIDNKNIENIICALNSSINNFSNNIYKEAIGDE